VASEYQPSSGLEHASHDCNHGVRDAAGVVRPEMLTAFAAGETGGEKDVTASKLQFMV
jgi:hypothetical protein